MTSRLSARERILRAIKVDDAGCWIWQLYVARDGYGRIRFEGRGQRAHRVSYVAFRQQPPDGLDLDHLCRVRACVNPDHLEPVTHQENMLRSPFMTTEALRARKQGPRHNVNKTHCNRGHEYTESNTYRCPSAPRSRICRACNRIREASRDRRKTTKMPPRTEARR